MTEASDDDISLTSTVPSPPKENYYVDTIHAERETSQGIEYLVGWADYPIERSSWETAAQFDDEQTLFDWEEKKREIAAGRLQEFDIGDFNRRLYEAEQACQNRKHKRHLKRERLAKGQPGLSNTGLFSSTSNGPGLADADVTLNSCADTANVYSSRATNQSQVGPARSQSISGGLTRPPLVGFGTGRGGIIRSRPRRSYDADSSAPTKMFKYLSTKNRYEKARAYEPAPDVSKLELMRPSEWSSTPAVHCSNPGPQHNISPKGQEPGESPRRTISEVPDIDTSVSQPQQSRVIDSNRSTHSSPVSDRPRRLFDGSQDLYLPRRRPGPEAKWMKRGRGGYFVNPGELLFTMYYGPDKREIGEFRMCGLDTIRRTRFLRTKKGHALEIWFQHLCNLTDYNTLCKKTANAKYWNGWVEGFDDSEPDIYRFAKDLSQKGLVAISMPEIPGHDVLLAYPPDSEDFGFLDGDFRGPGDVFLHTAVRSQLGPIERLALGNLQGQRGHLTDATTGVVNSSRTNTVFANIQASEAQREQAFLNQENGPSIIEAPNARIGLEPRPHANPATPLANRRTSSDSIPVVQRRSSGIDHMDIDQGSKDPTAAANSSKRQPSLGVQLPFDLDHEFEKRFGMTFQTLATVAEKRLAGSFCVLFPQGSGGIEEECQAVVEFLKAHNSDKQRAIIYSNRTPEDWEKFTQAKNGVILVHESFLEFYRLQGLNNLCRQSTFNFWSFSLNKELGDNQPYFRRMFQTGGVLLITADYILSDPRGTVVVLSWFEEYAKGRYPGTWKLMLPPDVLNWVQKQIEVTVNSRFLWLGMYHLILQITALGDAKSRNILTGAEGGYTPNTVISPSKLPGYGFRTDDEIPDLPKDKTLSQEQRNADHLIEFYAGWALINCYQFRKFLVLTASSLPRWDEWQHLQIYVGSSAIMKSLEINYKLHWEKLKRSAGSNSHSERGSQTPFTPQTPRAGPSSESATFRATSSYIPPPTYRYPEPYQ